MKTVYLFVAFFVWQSAHAQWFNNGFSFTTQNGLSNNTITGLQKDSAGFVWIGTHEGLNRYDGTAFISVLSNAKNNLPSNNITKICFISKTWVAVGTDAGLCLLNTATLAGHKIDLPFNPAFANTGYFISDIIYRQDARELWVCTWHGLFVLNKEGRLLRQLMATGTAMNKGFFARYLLKDNQKNIYFFSQQNQGFYYPDFSNQQLTPVEKRWPDFTLNGLLRDGYSLMSAQMLDHETTCVLSKSLPGDRDERLAYYNIGSGRNFINRLTVTGNGEKRISDAFPLNDSIFLVNSFFGEPLLYNIRRKELMPAADHPLWFVSWPDGFAAFACRDEQNIWIGTSKNLLQFSLKTDYFKTNPVFANRIKDNNSLVGCNYGLYHDHALWVACMGAGLFAVDTALNTVTPVLDKHTQPAFKRKLISTSVADAGKSLWLFSIYGPVEINGQTKKPGPVSGTNKDSSFDANASYPLADRQGNIWASVPDGITAYNIARNSFSNYTSTYKGGSFPLRRSGIKTADNHGNIWLAREDSLVKMDKEKTFSLSLLRKNGKSLRPVTSLASNGEDILYMAVAGAFGIYSVARGTIDLFTKQTGIVSTAINEIVSDKAGNAWIATEGGLVFYHQQKRKFYSFTRADGLPDDNVISINFTDPDKKVLFLGFSKTYCLFEPDNFLLEKKTPENVITGMAADGVDLDVQDTHVFSYKQNNISFTYTGINYNQGQQNNYACILDGFDQDWKYTGTERKINYIHLPPGNYTFKVKSANYQGAWNEQPAILAFTIKPPFWQTWWFRILAAGTVFFGLGYLIKRREHAFKKENTHKLQLSELRMQALRAQMNPHFIFNSLNSIQSYILTNNTIDAAAYLSKFAKLMRRILDQSKHSFLPLSEVMETLQLYVEIEAFRFNHEFSYTFDIARQDELLDMDLPPMLLQPFVENAILHGLMPKKGNKRLFVSCRLVDNRVIIIIDDNGVGRKTSAASGHAPQGGKLTAGMLESLQQIKNSKAFIQTTDKIEHERPAGTTVKLVLPLN